MNDTELSAIRAAIRCLMGDDTPFEDGVRLLHNIEGGSRRDVASGLCAAGLRILNEEREKLRLVQIVQKPGDILLPELESGLALVRPGPNTEFKVVTQKVNKRQARSEFAEYKRDRRRADDSVEANKEFRHKWFGRYPQYWDPTKSLFRCSDALNTYLAAKADEEREAYRVKTG